MKKLLLAVTVIFIICGCSSKQTLQTISYNELKEKINDKESFVLYIHKTGCTYCENYEPTLVKVLNEKRITAYSINTATLTKSEEASLKKKVDLKGTPTLIYINQGKSDVNGSLIGEKSYNDTLDFFKEIGYIK